MSNELDEILQLADKAVTSISGVSVVDARWLFQSGRRSLEVTIHRPISRISLDDCELMSRTLEKLLDESDPPVIDGAYILEVQSPGLERELKSNREFAAFIGENVEVNTREQIESLGWSFNGSLTSKDETTITIAQPRPSSPPAKTNKKSGASEPATALEAVTLKMDQVARVKLHPQFQKN